MRLLVRIDWLLIVGPIGRAAIERRLRPRQLSIGLDGSTRRLRIVAEKVLAICGVAVEFALRALAAHWPNLLPPLHRLLNEVAAVARVPTHLGRRRLPHTVRSLGRRHCRRHHERIVQIPFLEVFLVRRLIVKRAVLEQRGPRFGPERRGLVDGLCRVVLTTRRQRVQRVAVSNVLLLGAHELLGQLVSHVGVPVAGAIVEQSVGGRAKHGLGAIVGLDNEHGLLLIVLFVVVDIGGRGQVGRRFVFVVRTIVLIQIDQMVRVGSYGRSLLNVPLLVVGFSNPFISNQL